MSLTIVTVIDLLIRLLIHYLKQTNGYPTYEMQRRYFSLQKHNLRQIKRHVQATDKVVKLAIASPILFLMDKYHYKSYKIVDQIHQRVLSFQYPFHGDHNKLQDQISRHNRRK